MISININSHSLGGNLILENINLTVPDGKVLGLVGTNGSGKSTLLRLMSGVYVPDSGAVLYDGKDATLPAVREKETMQWHQTDQYLLSNLTLQAGCYF